MLATLLFLLYRCRAALQTGLGQKRKQPEAAAGGGGKAPPGRRGMLDSVLGDLGSDSDEEEEG